MFDWDVQVDHDHPATTSDLHSIIARTRLWLAKPYDYSVLLFVRQVVWLEQL